MFPTKTTVSKNTVRKIGHHARKIFVMEQFYHICVCSGIFHRLKLQFTVAESKRNFDR